MNCRNCRHRLDVTLWGVWLATGCRLGLPMLARCDAYSALTGPPVGIFNHPQFDTARSEQT